MRLLVILCVFCLCLCTAPDTQARDGHGLFNRDVKPIRSVIKAQPIRSTLRWLFRR